MKTKAKAIESESSSKAAAEIAKLKAEIKRLKTDREMLKRHWVDHITSQAATSFNRFKALSKFAID